MKSSAQLADSLIAQGPLIHSTNGRVRAAQPWQWACYTATLIFNDLVMVYLAFELAFSIRFRLWLPIFNLEAPARLHFYQNLTLILIPIYIGIFAIAGLYHRKNLLGGTREYALIFRAASVAFLLVILAGFLDPELIFARGWLLMVWGLTFVVTAFGRFGLRRVVYALRKRGHMLIPALIVGANEEGAALGEQLVGWHRSGLNIIGFIDLERPIGDRVINRLFVLGGLEELHDIVERYEVGEMVIATSALPREKMLEIFRRYGVSKSVNLRLSTGLFEIITTGLHVKELAYVPLVPVNQVRLTGLSWAVKVILDYGLTLPLVLLTSPLMLLIALLIRLESKGPIIFPRRVMGLNGSEFDAYKFRTMHTNGDEIMAEHPDLKARLEKNHKLKEDPRITRFGRLLRKSSLDELPQLINVLMGQMSLVGPRMISPPEMVNYDKWGINLLTVRPGITGLWQVSGRSDLSYQDRVRLDMQYIRNWTIWTDLYILIQTLPAVIRGRGAY